MVARTMLFVYARDGAEASGLDGLHPPTLLTE
jgi:hypothetical protein